MTKREMIDYIEEAKKDKAIRRLMKSRKVQDVEVSYSKVVITIAYKAVKQIKEDLGFIEGDKFLTDEEKKRRQKIHLMFYGKKDVDWDNWDNQRVIPERKLASQEPSKRSLRKVIIKCSRTGEEYSFYTCSFMKKSGLFQIEENDENTYGIPCGIPYLDLKKGDKLYKEWRYKNDTYNYVLGNLCGEPYLRNITKNALFDEMYEVIKVEDKLQNYLVYQITNDVDDIKYFGITNNFKRRYNTHFNEQKENKMLYHHMKEIGIEHFKMKPLYENIPTKRLAEKIETILIIGNIGSVSNEQISCQKWYDGHDTLNDIKCDYYTYSWFSTSDKEFVFSADYHDYLQTNSINFMPIEVSSKEEIIGNNLKELGLSNFDVNDVLLYDRNKVLLDIED